MNVGAVSSGPTAWDFSQVLGNLGIDLGFGDFAQRSWDFFKDSPIEYLTRVS